MISRRFLITFALICWLLLDNILCKPFFVRVPKSDPITQPYHPSSIVFCVEYTLDGLSACKKNDPRLNGCLLNMIKRVKPQLIRGNPELNLPPLDPIKIPTVTILKNLQDITVAGELIDLTARGASSINVKTLKVNLKEKTWDMVIVIPHIAFVTSYNLNIDINAIGMPIRGQGKCKGEVSRTVMHFHANTNVKGGKLKLENIEISLNIEDVIIQIIQSQNPELTKVATQFFNANKQLVLDLVTPIAEDSVKDLLLQYGNNILSTVEIKDLLAD